MNELRLHEILYEKIREHINARWDRYEASDSKEPGEINMDWLYLMLRKECEEYLKTVFKEKIS